MENCFDRALQVMEENFSHMVAMSIGSTADGEVAVRDIHAYYKDGKMFFLAKQSNALMKHIQRNPKVGLCHGSHTMQGVATSLGHPTSEQNKQLRKELKRHFSLNYNEYVDESCQEMCIVQIRLTSATTFSRYHRYEIDFDGKVATRDHHQPLFLYR